MTTTRCPTHACTVGVNNVLHFCCERSLQVCFCMLICSYCNMVIAWYTYCNLWMFPDSNKDKWRGKILVTSYSMSYHSKYCTLSSYVSNRNKLPHYKLELWSRHLAFLQTKTSTGCENMYRKPNQVETNHSLS